MAADTPQNSLAQSLGSHPAYATKAAESSVEMVWCVSVQHWQAESGDEKKNLSS